MPQKSNDRDPLGANPIPQDQDDELEMADEDEEFEDDEELDEEAESDDEEIEE